uniref:Sex-regulated protein janus-B n=1 Tax=Ornithodoros brasiliensis TaxID=888526 RepID=A0A1D2AIH4_ORNBR
MLAYSSRQRVASVTLALLRRTLVSMAQNPLDNVADVAIDTGRFKYVLIRVHDKQTDDKKEIVRGSASASYHADVYEAVRGELEKAGRLETECLGGGRIIHEPQKHHIEVFGHSEGYGRADHKRTCEILRQRFKDYDITWKNDGY